MLAGVPRLVDRMSAPNRQDLFRAAQWRVSPTTSDLGPRTSELRNPNSESDAGPRTLAPGRRMPAPGHLPPDAGRRTPDTGPRTPDHGRRPRDAGPGRTECGSSTQARGRPSHTADSTPRKPAPLPAAAELVTGADDIWMGVARQFVRHGQYRCRQDGEQVTTTNGVPSEGGCHR